MGKLMINGEQYPAIVVKAGLDDTQTRKDATWSSDKINEELEDVRSELDIIVEEANKNTSINDELESLTTTWSSKKTSDELAKKDDNANTFSLEGGDFVFEIALTDKKNNIEIVDNCGGKIEIYGNGTFDNYNNYKFIKVLRLSYGTWTTFDATTINDTYIKIKKVYIDNNKKCYVCVRGNANYIIKGTKSVEVKKLSDIDVAQLVEVPESQFASKSDLATQTANRQVKTFKNSGSTAKYYKICSAITAGYPYNIKATTGRIDSTVSVEYFSAIFRDSRYNYTSQVVLDGRFAYNQSVSTYKEYCPYFIVDANQDLYLYVPSYSQTTIEIDTRAITIDGTEGTPIEDYVYNSFDHRFDERINDSATNTTSTWSSSKIASTIDNKFLVGTSAPTTDTCPVGCFYGVYEE